MSVTIVVLLVAFVVNRYWSPILAGKIKNGVAKGSNGLYKVDFADVKLNILEGKLIFYNLTFKPDTDVYNKQNKQHLAPNTLFELHAQRLVLSHIHPFKLYFNHLLDINQMVLTNPEIRITYLLNKDKDTVTADNRTLWQKVKPDLRSIHIGNIFLNNANFKYYNHATGKPMLTELKEMDMHGNDLLIDSATQTDKSRFLYFKDVVADLNNYKSKSANGLYTYSVKRLKLSTRLSQVNAVELSWEPVKTALFIKSTRKDKFSLKLDSAQLNNFDFLFYHKYRTISCSSLILSNGNFDIFNNPNKIKTFKNKITSFPGIAVHRLKTEVKIDTVIIKHVDINYSEFNKKSRQIGTISFNNTNAKVFNFTNNKIALQKNNIGKIRVSSRFMDHGKLDVAFVFNLTDKNASYSYKGSLGTMGLQAVNPATIPLAMIKISSGTLKSLNFDFKADSKRSKGKVIFLYNDLKVNILRADTTNAILKKKLIETLFANLFILKHNNPDKEGEIPRTFNVNYTRPINTTFFSTLWKTLLIGIKPAVGYDDKTRKAATERMAQGDLNKKIARQKRNAQTTTCTA
ncbi:hypothetical protein HK413_12650 [Mucilaginibacter sp. S1162]|uniref:AsmA-like C-terminal domain-containing protein n=1 Tax=Mucilaginibacter humi TaxID=2732510 RepID=A0ABX1W774_9SPHI|nr:hypothetical protein [Mucilaginibacter humi]NNU34696.1 hypothetical protein [Mucilaginibacter humi]